MIAPVKVGDIVRICHNARPRFNEITGKRSKLGHPALLSEPVQVVSVALVGGGLRRPQMERYRIGYHDLTVRAGRRPRKPLVWYSYSWVMVARNPGDGSVYVGGISVWHKPAGYFGPGLRGDEQVSPEHMKIIAQVTAPYRHADELRAQRDSLQAALTVARGYLVEHLIEQGPAMQQIDGALRRAKENP